MLAACQHCEQALDSAAFLKSNDFLDETLCNFLCDIVYFADIKTRFARGSIQS